MSITSISPYWAPETDNLFLDEDGELVGTIFGRKYICCTGCGRSKLHECHTEHGGCVYLDQLYANHREHDFFTGCGKYDSDNLGLS